MAGYEVTIRQGSKVRKVNEPTLDDAMERLRAEAEAISDDASLPAADVFKRTYEPGQRSAGRVEVSAGRFPRKRVAGVDIKGNGSIVAYVGRIAKNVLDPAPDETPYEAVRKALRRD